jgi:hypothetical protein
MLPQRTADHVVNIAQSRKLMNCNPVRSFADVAGANRWSGVYRSVAERAVKVAAVLELDRLKNLPRRDPRGRLGRHRGMPDHSLAKVQRCPSCRMSGTSSSQSIGRAWPPLGRHLAIRQPNSTTAAPITAAMIEVIIPLPSASSMAT